MMSQILIMLQTELRIFPLPPNRIDLLSTTHPTAKSWELLSPSPPGTYGWPRLLLSPAKYLVTVTTSLHSSRPKLPSSFIWTYSEVCFFSKPCLFLAASLLQTASSSAAAWQQTPLRQPIMHRTLGICGHPLMSHTSGPCPVLQPSRTGPPAVPPTVKQRECFYDLLHTLWYSLRFINQHR